jgi:tRNA A37 methylthiotransferase MiaB
MSAAVKTYHLALTEQRFAALLRLLAECDEDTLMQLGMTKPEADMLSDLFMAMELARQAQFTGTNVNVTTH